MKYYFVCGTKRSATHFLNRLLDGHHQLGNTIVESYIFEYYLGQGARYEDIIVSWLKSAPVQEIYKDILARQLLPGFSEHNYYDNADPEGSWFELQYDMEAFCRRLGEERHRICSMRDLVAIWMEIMTEFQPWSVQRERASWVFKCADFGATLQGAAKMGVLGKCVFLVREPEGIVSSIKKRRERERRRSFHFFELIQICEALESTVQLIEAFSKNCLVMKYEDLISKSKKETERLCDFWQVAWSIQLERPTILGKEWRVNSSFSEKTGRVNVLSNFEKQYIEKNTTKYRQRFGF